jgi:hypothetical protein
MEVEKKIDDRIDESREQTLQKERERFQKEKAEVIARREEVARTLDEKVKDLRVRHFRIICTYLC